MTEVINNIKKILILTCCMFLLSVGILEAYSIETIPDPGNVVGDFVVGPGKVEVELEPGEGSITNILVTNRMGDRRQFDLVVEDAQGSNDPKQTVVLLGTDRGPYSLRDYISFEEPSFILEQGERATVPVKIEIPEDAEPGGLYGSVLITTTSVPGETAELGVGQTRGGAVVVSRIGTLFFVTVPGEVEHSAELASFTTIPNKSVFQSGPIRFQILFKNSGSVHLNPFGDVKITNILGEEVGSVEALPWFALPDSTRLKEVTWDRPYLFGRYTATAEINRGYDDITDSMSVTFWVLPAKTIGLGVLGLIIVIFFIRLITRNFSIQRRPKDS